jgi:succinyl-CoA synthetase alpha subunit
VHECGFQPSLDEVEYNEISDSSDQFCQLELQNGQQTHICSVEGVYDPQIYWERYMRRGLRKIGPACAGASAHSTCKLCGSETHIFPKVEIPVSSLRS